VQAYPKHRASEIGKSISKGAAPMFRQCFMRTWWENAQQVMNQ
jgi:hypothetical protein